MIFQVFVTLMLINISCAQIFVNENDIPELAYLDKTVDPCDNFYKYTCGNFKNVHPLPDGDENIDHFSILQEEIHEMAKQVLESTIENEDPVGLQKAKTFYKTCKKGVYEDTIFQNTPVFHFFESFGEWPVITPEVNDEKKMTWTEIGDVIADYGIPFFFDLSVTSSHFNSTSNIIYLNKDPLSNPDAGIIGNIPKDGDFLAQRRTKRGTNEDEPIPYEDFLRNISLTLRNLSGYFTPEISMNKDIAKTVMFLRNISADGIPPVNINITTLPTESTIKQLQEWTDTYFGEEVGMNWMDFLQHVFKYTGVEIKEDMKIMQDSIKKIYGILNLYSQSDSDSVKNYITARMLTYMAPDCNCFMIEELKDLYNALDYEVYEREEYCLRKTLGYPGNIAYSNAITYEYQRYYFNYNKLEKAAQMVRDLLYSFLDILDSSTWMDDSSRQKAQLKALNIITLLGYDEKFEHAEEVDAFYENLQVCTWDHFGNSQRLRAFNRALNLKEIGSKKNRQLWNLSPLEVNAFYNRANNRILFPVSILNPVFFNGNISLLDYSRMGAIIGHEITHGFDDMGRRYSEQGTLTDWWSKETAEAFVEKADCFEEQYGKYYIEEIDKYVDGAKTLNENLADNGGLHAAYKSVEKVRSRSSDTVVGVKGYTSEQLFFIGYGTMWCSTETPYYLEKMHETLPYAPGRYRVNGAVSNMKEFAEAFNCPADSNMNRADSCSLW